MRKAITLVLPLAVAAFGFLVWQLGRPARSRVSAAPEAARTESANGQEVSLKPVEKVVVPPGERREDLVARSVEPAGKRERPRSAPTGPGAIEGVVVSRDPDLAPPFEVWLVYEEDGETWRSRQNISRTDDEGRFEFKGVAPGVWQVEVRAAPPEAPDSEKRGTSGFLSGFASVPFEKVTPPLAVESCRLSPGERLSVEISLGLSTSEGCHVRGTLSGMDPSGRIEYSVALYVAVEEGAGPGVEAQPDVAGLFDLGRVPPGPATLHVRGRVEGSKGLWSGITSRMLQLSAGEERRMVIELPAVCLVEFELVDKGRSRRIRSGELLWKHRGDNYGASMYTYPLDEVTPLPEGEYVALGRAPGYRAVLDSFHIAAHQPAILVRIEMDRTPAATATRLVDRDGQEIANATLTVRNLDGVDLRRSWMVSVETNEEGFFDMASFPAGRGLVHVQRPAPIDPAVLEAASGGPEIAGGWGTQVIEREVILDAEVEMDLRGYPKVIRLSGSD